MKFGELLALRNALLPRDTNGAGTIFGGVILSMIDLAGAHSARAYAGHRYVTVAMKEVKFIAPVYVGDIVSCYGKILRVGTTSITVLVRVEAQRFSDCQENVEVTTAEISYVAVDEDHKPIPIDPNKACSPQ